MTTEQLAANKEPIVLDYDPLKNCEVYLARRKYDDGHISYTPISNFRFTIKKNILNVETQRITREIIITGDRSTESFELDPEAAFSPSKIQSFCFSRGQYFIEANKKDLIEIWKMEVDEGPQEIIKQSDYIGYIPSLGCWIFGDCLLKKNADKDWSVTLPKENRVFVLNDDTTLTYRILSESSGRMPNLQTVKEELTLAKANELIFNAQFHKGQLGLAWVACQAFLPEIIEKYGKFPLLFLSGITQSGKTWLASALMQCSGIFAEGVKVKETSPYGLTLLLSYFSSLPVWLDEYLVNEKSSQELNHFMKNVYDRQSTIKGALNNRIREYFVRGALMVTGEEFPNIHSVLSRCICLELSKNERGDPDELDKHRHLLPQVLERLLKKKTPRTVSQFFRLQKRLQGILQKQVKDFRISFNYSLVIAAFRVMFGPGKQLKGRKIQNEKGRQRPETFMRWAVLYAANDQISKETETLTTQFMTDVIGLMDDGVVKEDELYKIEYENDGHKLYLALPDIYRRWEEFSVKRQRNKTYVYATLLRDFKEEPYYAKELSEQKIRRGLRQKSLGIDKKTGRKKYRSCLCLHVERMPQHLQESLMGIWGEDPSDYHEHLETLRRERKLSDTAKEK